MELSAAAVCGHSLLPCGLVFGSGLAAQIIAPPMLCSLTNFVTFLSLSRPSHTPEAACSPGAKPMLRLRRSTNHRTDALKSKRKSAETLVIWANGDVPMGCASSKPKDPLIDSLVTEAVSKYAAAGASTDVRKFLADHFAAVVPAAQSAPAAAAAEVELTIGGESELPFGSGAIGILRLDGANYSAPALDKVRTAAAVKEAGAWRLGRSSVL